MSQDAKKSKPRKLQWFRFYSAVIHDTKVQRLSPHLFKTWVNVLCLAADNDGQLPSIDDIAFQLRMSSIDAQQQFDDLVLVGLIDIHPDGTKTPHNWDVRQFKSDTSAERTKKWREKKVETSPETSPETSRDDECDVTCDVTVTPPEAETEADTEPDIQLAPQQVAAREVAAALPMDAKELSKLVFEAAGPALASEAIAPGLASMMIPQMWLDQGCDLHRDVLETLRAQAVKRRNIKSWSYFTGPIAEARAQRLIGLPKVDITQAQQKPANVATTRAVIEEAMRRMQANGREIAV